MEYIKKLNEYFDLENYYNVKLIDTTKKHIDRFLKTFPKFNKNIKTYTYSFGENNEYEIDINFNEIKKYLSLSFTNKNTMYSNTNKFDQIKVLNTVFNTLLDFIIENNIENIFITAEPKRFRIYKIVAHKMIKNWNIKETDIIDGRNFLIISKYNNVSIDGNTINII
jgi:hypothetical protein